MKLALALFIPGVLLALTCLIWGANGVWALGAFLTFAGVVRYATYELEN